MQRLSDMSRPPKVIVILPFHNAQSTLAIAIASIVFQTYENWSLLLIDDCSSDESRYICNYFVSTYPKKIRYIRTTHKLGQGGEAAFNYGLQFVRSADYIAKMDADDVSNLNRLKIQVDYLRKHPLIFLVSSNLYLIDTNNRLVGVRKYPEKNKDIVHEFYLRSCIANPAIMFKFDPCVFQNRGFYQFKFSALNDYYTFYLLLTAGKRMHNIQKPLLCYRLHQSTLLATIKKNWSINLKIKSVIAKNPLFKPTIPHRISIFLLSLLIYLTPQKVLSVLHMYSPRK